MALPHATRSADAFPWRSGSWSVPAVDVCHREDPGQQLAVQPTMLGLECVLGEADR